MTDAPDFSKGASGPASVYDTSPGGLGISPSYLSPGATATASASGGGGSTTAWNPAITPVTTSGTTFAAGADVLAVPLAFVSDGVSTYTLTVTAPYWTNSLATENQLRLNLDGTDDGIFLQEQITLPTNGFALAARATFGAAAGAHTVNARLVVVSGSGTITGGSGGAGNPMAILVTLEQL